MGLDWTRGQNDWLLTQTKSFHNLSYLVLSSSCSHGNTGTVPDTIEPQSSAHLHHVRAKGVPMSLPTFKLGSKVK